MDPELYLKIDNIRFGPFAKGRQCDLPVVPDHKDLSRHDPYHGGDGMYLEMLGYLDLKRSWSDDPSRHAAAICQELPSGMGYDSDRCADTRCPSRWIRHPIDMLWKWQGRRVMLLNVAHYNLKFHDSSFKHRYNRYIREVGDHPELDKLAAKERDEHSGSSGVEWIPFKDPHPCGYQGVLGNFDDWLSRDGGRLRRIPIPVRDRFANQKHLLEVGW